MPETKMIPALSWSRTKKRFCPGVHGFHERWEFVRFVGENSVALGTRKVAVAAAAAGAAGAVVFSRSWVSVAAGLSLTDGDGPRATFSCALNPHPPPHPLSPLVRHHLKTQSHCHRLSSSSSFFSSS